MDFEPIPGPRGLPFLGNALDVQHEEAPLLALEHLADIYGPIYQLNLGGKRQIIVSGADLMKEFLDEKRFLKNAIPGLHSDNHPDGLIVAHTFDPDWGQAHRILRPAFGPINIEDMFEKMKDTARQLLLKWARFGADEDIKIDDDFSNLALDTVALCTMDYRFNSFYRDGAHPYVQAMNVRMAANSNRSRTVFPILGKAMSLVGAGGGGGPDPAVVQQAGETMKNIAQGIIDQRRSRSTRKNDFLDMVLYGKDPKTGDVMRDELIHAQMQAFLIAGHETTSGLLSFAVMYLLQNPVTYRKAQDEVDHVVGAKTVTIEEIRNLKYIYAVLQETLRLAPTAPVIGKIPLPQVFETEGVFRFGCKYKLEPTDRVRVLFSKAMSDPQIFGEDANIFNPDRMLESNPDHDRLDPYWRPFSEGSRACIGRPFALQEATLALAMALQNFDLRLTNPLYKKRIRHTVTIKPVGLYIKASLRHGMTPADLERRLYGGEVDTKDTQSRGLPSEAAHGGDGGVPLQVLFGSNQGTSQALAQRLAAEAATRYGYNAHVIEMDAAVGNLSKEHPTIVVTSSYEGEPPDNALHFIHWLETLKDDELKGVKFAVFGCGHKDWHATFHRIPRLVNDVFHARGGEAIAEIGLSDVSRGNPMADFEIWLDNKLLPQLKNLSPDKDNAEPKDIEIEADISTGERVATLRQDLDVGTVKDVKVLTASAEVSEKRHMEIELPSEQTYECGDYLAVLPQSPETSVKAVMAHFKLPSDATIILKSKTFSPLPLNHSLSVTDLLRNYYELAKPATKRGITIARKQTTDEATHKILTSWIEDDSKFQSEITECHTSVFDILQKYPSIDLPFPTFLSLLPQLNIRQYSISSSPLANPTSCTITYTVVADNKATSERPFHGVATTYLSTLRPGDRIQVAIRKTAKQAFRLPLDAEKTPILMFCAGSGLAPFRGFIQHRAIQLEANPSIKLADAHLFIGCRTSDGDRLYAEEMDKWEKVGAVACHYSFSRETEKSDGCKYVSDRMVKDKEILVQAWMAGARAYTCGNRKFAVSVSEATQRMVEARMKDLREQGGLSEKEIGVRVRRIKEAFRERAADDVFD